MNTPSTTATRLRIVAAFALIYLVWGSTYLAIRIGIDSWPPFFMAGTRFVIAGTVLYVLSRLRGAPRPTWRHWRSAAIVGGLMLVGGNGGVTWAEQRVASGLAALLIATVPLWIVLLDWGRAAMVRASGRSVPGDDSHESRPTGRVVLGLLLGLAGVILLVRPTDLMGGHHVDVIGVIAVLLAALSWGLGSLISRYAPLPEAPLHGTAMEMLAGGAMLYITAVATGEWGRIDLVQVSLNSWLALGYMIIFGSMLAFTAYVWLLRVSTPARASTYAYVNPVIAMFLGWAVLGEPLSVQMVLAAGIIVAAVAMITSGSSRQKAESARSSTMARKAPCTLDVDA